MKNVFYFRHLNVIGGIEQFFAYLAEKYHDWDITIIYKTGDKQQILRLRKWVNVIKFTGQKITCDKVFFCFNSDIREYITAKETALILHGDYKAMVEQKQLSRNSNIFSLNFDKYYGVSQIVCDSWKELTGNDAQLVYNPFIKYPKKKLYRLVYCGRLTPEKGGDLIEKLLRGLDNRGIDYLLYVYSDKQPFNNKNVVHMHTRLDAGQFLTKENYDYLILPSKNEGYCYTLVQALSNGLPVIATPCPVFKEIGVSEDNSITIGFNGENIDEVIDNMISKNLNFSYTPKEDTWDKVLAEGKSQYDQRFVTLKALRNYYDIELGERIVAGMIYNVTEQRAELILNHKFAELYKKGI